MRIQAMLLVAIPVLVAGCSSPKPEFYWYQPGKTFEEVKADYAECEIQARDEAEKRVNEEYFDRLRSPTILTGDEEQPARKNKPGEAELKAKAHWGELYKQNAFAGCMQGRGYVKLRGHQASPSLRTKKLPMGAIAGE